MCFDRAVGLDFAVELTRWKVDRCCPGPFGCFALRSFALPTVQSFALTGWWRSRRRPLRLETTGFRRCCCERTGYCLLAFV